MRRIPHRWTALKVFQGRCFSESILGTSTLSGNFLKSLHEDLKQEQAIRSKGMGETLENFVNRAELSHMESPEADAAFLKKVDTQIDDLFAKLPLPADPMRAALARTEDELESEASLELIREAVRAEYHKRLDAKQAEELRLRRAMKKAATQSTSNYFSEKEGTPLMAEVQPMQQPMSAKHKGTAGEGKEELRRQLEEMRRKIKEMEERLNDDDA